MTELRANAATMAAALANKEISARELTQAHLDQIAAVDGQVHAFLHVNAEEALAVADEVDQARARGEELPVLAGVPVAVKDLICTKGQPTTAASKILEGWIPPYDATLVEKLRAAKMPILGKTNLDEFAMGSSTEFSAFGPTRNPWDLDRIPGGSGGGSAAAVAAFEAPLAIGTDTGGSIRQPAAVTGTVGAKPTYGGVSRYGVIAMASSLDQPGPVARTVLDTALLQEVIGGYDPHDSTSLPDEVGDLATVVREADLKGVRIGVVQEIGGDGFQAEVSDRFEKVLDLARQAGATVETISCPSFDYALAAYYLIMPAEVSSNLARYDGMRYGLRVAPTEGPVTAETVMAATRGAGFGPEVKRRIILGTHALSSGFVDAYYMSAQRVRTLVQRDLAAAWEKVDVLISPTAPTAAFKFGEKIDDPMAMYLNDIATIPANLAGIPGIAIPSGLDDAGLPVSVQILAPARQDHRMYRVAGALERLLEQDWGGPLIGKAPKLEELIAARAAGQRAPESEEK